MKIKSNFFKYVFFIVVIALVGYCIYIVNENNKKTDISQVEKTDNIETTVLTDLRLSIVNFDTMNPILSNNKNVQDISRLIYEPLLNITEDYKIELCLAKEYSKIDATTYLIKLKENVKWQDGQILKAKDVQYTIDRLKDTPSIYSSNVARVSEVEVVDDCTVRITLFEEIPFFEYHLNFPIMSCVYYENEDFSSTPKNNNPVGTGRYKISSVEGSTITLKRNQNWWNLENENSKIDTINLNLYTSIGEAYNAFKLGNLDLISTSSLNIEEYIGTIGYNSKEYKGREYDYIAMNCNNAILKDAQVRKAICYAIDRSNIIANVYNNKYYLADFPLDYGNYLYNKERVDSGYNQNTATELLAQSGWEYKNKNWQKKEKYNTLRLKLNLVVNTNHANRVAVAENIKVQLENIGINVNIIKASDSQYQNYLINKNYDMILTGIVSGYSPNINTFLGDQNIANYNNEEVKTLLSEINNISDEKLLKEKYDRLIQLYEEQRPYISLYYNRNTVIYSKNLIGNVNPNSYNIFYNIGSWYRQ